ncbi:MAG: YbdK family carboxylate-amine ligase [Solirubrobacterales bacterium]
MSEVDQIATTVFPTWAEWSGAHELGSYTLGVEEEAMLLDPRTWALAHRIDDLLPRLSAETQEHVTAETHGSAFEVQTGVASTVSEAMDELLALRAELERTLGSLGLRAAVAGTHPFAIWQEIAVSGGDRHQFVYGSMRELARREPTFALHVHVGIPDPDTAIRVSDRMRAHLPLLLALSANSPFWQGRDSGLASARTPLFQAFPRVGVPRAFGTYEAYAETVDLLIRTEAVPECTFLWWDVRPQPALGTVEIRVMDAQTRCRDTAALVALVQCLVKLEAEQGYTGAIAISAQEVIAENRFLAARDGVEARLIDPELETRVPVPELLADVLSVCAPHAQDLGCEAELASVTELVENPPAQRQIDTAKDAPSLGRLVERLADRFAE